MLLRALVVLFILLFNISIHADPWFTGPILAPAGKTIPAGHTNLELYETFVKDSGFYDTHWHTVATQHAYSDQYTLIFSHGLAKAVDFQFVLPYVVNETGNRSAQDIGDVIALLGFQLLTQKEHDWIPNLRFTVQEIIPTGRFEQLNSSLLGTDVTGSGSYQTVLSLNFQDLSQPVIDHYIRTRLSLGYAMPQSAPVNANSRFGTGDFTTNASLHPGDTFSLDLASEITLTQHWVAVMEGLWTSTNRGHFSGNPGITLDNDPENLGDIGYNALVSLAPAVEYNFNANFGVIAGSWFTVAGKNNALIFKTFTLAFNAFW